VDTRQVSFVEKYVPRVASKTKEQEKLSHKKKRKAWGCPVVIAGCMSYQRQHQTPTGRNHIDHTI
jgi:hypothetical protein